ncbi:hypothetical protein MMC19_002094 [Ptychographa xylographoides]|nr:hypothetical protein [Ptychographa xylographoides]
MRSSEKPGNKPKHGEPFDPDDLYRRLERYKESQARAHERRKAKAEKNKPPEQYHHTPQFAAADMLSTASPEWIENQHIHPLSRLRIRQQKAVDPVDPKVMPITQQVEQQDSAHQKMMAVAERNQFQRTRMMETAAEVDEDRDIRKPLQRRFEPISSHTNTRSKAGDGNKTPGFSDPESMDEGTGTPMISKRQVVFNPDDRHDWAQRDACAEPERRSFMTMLRKTHLLGGNKGQQSETSLQEKRKSRRKSSFLSFPLANSS